LLAGTIGLKEFRIFWASAGFAGGYWGELLAECWKSLSEQGRTFPTIRRIAGLLPQMSAEKC
jgi:hypothetical protein